MLASIVDYGLVLTPETLRIAVNAASQRKQPCAKNFTQIRACFTLLSRSQLFRPRAPIGNSDNVRSRSHADLFGNFAIGLNPIRARELGAVAVTYFYRSPGQASESDNVALEMLFRLRELHVLLCALAYLEARGRPAGRTLVPIEVLRESNLALHGEAREEDVERKILSLDERTAALIYECLDTDRVPAWNLADWVEILLNSYQTADSKEDSTSLEYYEQREWRLIRMVGTDSRLFPLRESDSGDRHLLSSVRSTLQDCDPAFFTEAKLAESWLLTGTSTRSFFDYVEEIVVPSATTPEVEKLLQSRRLAPHFEMREVMGVAGHSVFVRRH